MQIISSCRSICLCFCLVGDYPLIMQGPGVHFQICWLRKAVDSNKGQWHYTVATFRLLLLWTRTRLNHPVKRMARRNVLITGCSSGIGLALAVKMAKDEQKRFKGNNVSVIYLYKNIFFKVVLFFFLCDLTGDFIQFGDLFLVSFPLLLSRKYNTVKIHCFL